MRKFLTDSRERSNSCSRGDELKRKREKAEEDGKDNQTIKRSSRISPVKQHTTMDPLLAEVLREIKNEMSAIRTDIHKMRQDMKDELKGFMDKIEAGNCKRDERIARVEKAVEELQNREERREKQERKNNIIIKGDIEVRENEWKDTEKIKMRVKQICEEATGEEVKVDEAFRISKQDSTPSIIKAKLANFETKLKVMKAKSKLNRGVYIEDDLTKHESGVQGILRKRAREEREKGNTTKVGYQKLYINGRKEYLVVEKDRIKIGSDWINLRTAPNEMEQ